MYAIFYETIMLATDAARDTTITSDSTPFSSSSSHFLLRRRDISFGFFISFSIIRILLSRIVNREIGLMKGGQRLVKRSRDIKPHPNAAIVIGRRREGKVESSQYP